MPADVMIFGSSLSQLWQGLISDLGYMGGWEAVAVVLALAYLLLASKQSVWCWPAAFISTFIYTVLFWKIALLMESALNGYYLLMAVYGYWQWCWGDRGEQMHVQTRPLQWHLRVISVTGIVALLIGYLMSEFTHADFAYLDALTSTYAVVTTWMLTQKIRENWWYWLVIDAASIYLYLQKSLVLTALLFVVYLVLAVRAYFIWGAPQAQQQTAHA